jgi:hypothetical protein
VGKPEGKRPLGIPGRKWVYNFKMNLGEMFEKYLCEGSNQISCVNYYFHNLINKVTSLTRVTNRSDSLLNVMVINRQFNNIIEVVNIDYSDQLAQILWVSVDKGNEESEKVCKESTPIRMLISS